MSESNQIEEYCKICYNSNVEVYVCDRCQIDYCYDCAYTFSVHYQYQGNLCYLCSDQSRKSKLTKNDIRNNKIKLINGNTI